MSKNIVIIFLFHQYKIIQINFFLFLIKNNNLKLFLLFLLNKYTVFFFIKYLLSLLVENVKMTQI